MSHQYFLKKPGKSIVGSAWCSLILKLMAAFYIEKQHTHFCRVRLYTVSGGRICGQVHLGRSGHPSSEPALRQCHETSLTFSDDRADFGQCEEVVSFFIGLFCEEKRPQPLKKPKKSKGSFFEQNIPLKWYHFERLGKSASGAVNGSDRLVTVSKRGIVGRVN